MVGLVINGGVVNLFFNLVVSRLTLHWRAWLTRDLVRRYLNGRAYFRIEQDNDVDNIDQRIQQEVGPFCGMAMTLPWVLLYTGSGLSVQGWILKSIAPALFLRCARLWCRDHGHYVVAVPSVYSLAV
ncbi:hypothetical protein [Paraburkholderia diazotrophica]|uniref:hypothetical protein n=1 Tax=Paraburkholderia diazotrophica TaxID=667676 RepID=UPI00317646DD